MRPRGGSVCGGGIGGRRARKGGFALLVVLFFAILLAVAAGGYAMKINTSHRLAVSRAESCKLLLAARGGVEEAKARLWKQAYGVFLHAEDTGAGSPPPPPVPAEQAPQGIQAAPEPLMLDLEGAKVVVEFEDEAGKLPVNNFAWAAAADSKSLTNCLVRLFSDLELKNPTSLAAAVRDFIDRDSKGTGERGARNGPVFHVSELAAARGFDPETLYVPRSGEVPPAAWCLTTWHTGKVNVNSAGGIVLSALAPRLTDGEIEAIIAARAERPFSSVEDLRARVTVGGEAYDQLTREIAFNTDTFSLYVEAGLGVFRRRVKAVVWVESSAAHTLYFGEDWEF